jgi:hypothetical protein
MQTSGHGNKRLQDLIGNKGDTTVKTMTINENNHINQRKDTTAPSDIEIRRTAFATRKTHSTTTLA